MKVNLDSWESGDEDPVVKYKVEEDGDLEEDVQPSMEMEMNPVFLLMHHIEVLNIAFIIHYHSM